MEQSGSQLRQARPKPASGAPVLSPEHYMQLIWHRKWMVLGVFALITAATTLVSRAMPDIFTSETVILVDPQKVPENYVKPTVTGDVRNRLSTLSQQILSATRLQKIIDTLNLYPEERKRLTREEIITRMRKDVSVNLVSAGTQDLQAFRIAYRGTEPRLVAQVANELASLFIEENLKAREQQATGTAEFLQNQLQETRKTLEIQEAKLKEFKLRHVGEMPEQQTATLQVLGQLQSQLQIESDALGRAEQQKSYLQSMMASQNNAPVIDMDQTERRSKRTAARPTNPAIIRARARLAQLLDKYSEQHPDVRRLKEEIAEAEAMETKEAESVAQAEPEETPTVARAAAPAAAKYTNPVVESQLRAVEAEIRKRREEQQRISRQIAIYQGRLEAIPVREQQMTELVRDYETSKTHYKQLLENQLSADTATQLEIRQKSERFSILDPAQPAEKPTSPNRPLINLIGAVTGLGLGLMLALASEFLGSSITAPEQVTETINIPVLEVIPMIHTYADRRVRKKRLVWAGVSCLVVTVLTGFAYLIYQHVDLPGIGL